LAIFGQPKKPCGLKASLQKPHLTIQSVVATGGVYKGQGRNQRELMTRTYWEFLVQGQ